MCCQQHNDSNNVFVFLLSLKTPEFGLFPRFTYPRDIQLPTLQALLVELGNSTGLELTIAGKAPAVAGDISIKLLIKIYEQKNGRW